MPSFEFGIARSLAVNTLKSIIENPIIFERTGGQSTITNASTRFTPLNKPFTEDPVVNTTNGIMSPSISETSIDGTTESAEHLTNGVSDNTTSEKKDEISMEWSKAYSRAPGLRNFGASCYMNSTLQALMHIPPLVHSLLSRSHEKQCRLTRISISNI